MPQRRTARNGLTRSALGATWLVAACFSGCSCDEQATQSGSAPAAQGASPALPSAPATLYGLGAGEAQLTWLDGRLDLRANHAPRRIVLEQLALEADFELVTGEGDWPPLSASFSELTLAEALPILVGKLGYRAKWRREPDGSPAHRLETLHVGEVEEPAPPAPRPQLPDVLDESQADEERHVRPQSPTTDSIGALDEYTLGSGDEELLAALDDPDPERRAAAAREVEPSGEGLVELRRLLAEDPDPRVRAATTDALEESESYVAVQALVDALDDPDPEVLVEVIDALEFLGDESVVPALEPLREHRDEDVREAAIDAIDFLGP